MYHICTSKCPEGGRSGVWWYTIFLCIRNVLKIDQRTHTSDSSKPTQKFESRWGNVTICDGASAAVHADMHLRSVENLALPKQEFALP